MYPGIDIPKTSKPGPVNDSSFKQAQKQNQYV